MLNEVFLSAEISIAEVSDSRQNETILAELWIDRCCDYSHFREGIRDIVNTLTKI